MEVNYLYNTCKYENLYTKHNGISYELDDKFMKKYTITPEIMDNCVFKNHGFEKINLNDNIIELLKTFSQKEKFDQKCIYNIMNEIEIFISEWAKKNIIMDVDITVLDSVYRDSNPKNKNPFSNIPLTHIDFDSFMSDLAILYPFMDTWGPRLENTLGPEVYSEKYWYSGKKIVKICNVWVSLNDEIKNHNLGLVDMRTVKQDDLIEYIAKRKIGDIKNDGKFGSRRETFIATSLLYSNKHKWYYNPEMKFGSAIIFDSKNVPHSSMENPENKGHFRKSIEFRIIFTKKNSNIPKHIADKYYSYL